MHMPTNSRIKAVLNNCSVDNKPDLKADEIPFTSPFPEKVFMPLERNCAGTVVVQSMSKCYPNP